MIADLVRWRPLPAVGRARWLFPTGVSVCAARPWSWSASDADDEPSTRHAWRRALASTPLFHVQSAQITHILTVILLKAGRYGVGKWVPAIAGKAKAGTVHSDCGWTCGCAGKTVRSLKNTCHTWALLQWCCTKRRYIKCTYLYLLPLGPGGKPTSKTTSARPYRNLFMGMLPFGSCQYNL